MSMIAGRRNAAAVHGVWECACRVPHLCDTACVIKQSNPVYHMPFTLTPPVAHQQHMHSVKPSPSLMQPFCPATVTTRSA